MFKAYTQSDEVQKEIIPALAEKYANKLSAILAPLFVSDSSTVTDDIFHSWGQAEESSRARRQTIISFFDGMLKIKAMSVVSGETYQLLWVPIQERIDGNDTQVDKNCYTTEEAAGKGLCVFPAIYVNEPKEMDGEKVYSGDIDEVVCHSKNFKRVHDKADCIGWCLYSAPADERRCETERRTCLL